MREFGQIELDDEVYELSAYPYRDDEDRVCCPLTDGRILKFTGCWVTSMKFLGLDSESNMLVGNDKTWPPPNSNV